MKKKIFNTLSLVLAIIIFNLSYTRFSFGLPKSIVITLASFIVIALAIDKFSQKSKKN